MLAFGLADEDKDASLSKEEAEKFFVSPAQATTEAQHKWLSFLTGAYSAAASARNCPIDGDHKCGVFCCGRSQPCVWNMYCGRAR